MRCLKRLPYQYCSELAQCPDDCLDSVQAILPDPLAPSNLSEAGVCSLIQSVSKFFLMDGKLMQWDLKGCHKVVILREKCFSLISPVHEVVGHRDIFSTLSNLWEGSGGLCWTRM